MSKTYFTDINGYIISFLTDDDKKTFSQWMSFLKERKILIQQTLNA